MIARFREVMHQTMRLEADVDHLPKITEMYHCAFHVRSVRRRLHSRITTIEATSTNTKTRQQEADVELLHRFIY